MASRLLSFLIFLFIFLLTFHSSTQQKVPPELVIEEGYTVSTVFDGNKLNNPINPSYLLPRFTGSTRDLVVVDSPSSVFYTISFPISQDSEVNRFCGNGTNGFADGDLGSTMFSHPKSFAVDAKGNVYVADKTNHTIRKISKLGVSTIAGGYSRKPGKKDGPAQDALFSEDFELTFVPELCALLISDRGNRLIRQMNLKQSDCSTGSGSQLQMGFAWASLLGVACLLIGLVIGFVAHPFVISREVTIHNWLSKTWKHCQINLGKLVLTGCSDFRSAIASSLIYALMDRLLRMSLSHISLIFRISRVEKQSSQMEHSSLLDSDCRSKEPGTTKPPMLADQLKDLINFDGDLDASEGMNNDSKKEDKNDVLTDNFSRIDDMIQANISDFDGQATKGAAVMGTLVGKPGLIRRK